MVAFPDPKRRRIYERTWMLTSNSTAIAPRVFADDGDKRRVRSLSLNNLSSSTILPAPGPLRKSLYANESVRPKQTYNGIKAKLELESTFHEHVRFTRISRLKLFMLKTLIALMASVSVAWMLWLVLLAVKPNDTVNWVMNSEEFDDGTFWLMVDPPSSIGLLSICGFSLIALVHIATIMRLFSTRERIQPAPRSSLTRQVKALKENMRRDIIHRASDRPRNKYTWILARLALRFVQDDSVTVRIVRVWVKCADLAVETVLVYQTLESGAPIVLVATFTAIVGFNALSCLAMMFLPDDTIQMNDVFVDILFDFLFAVGFPIFTVIYCLAGFHLDREKLKINLQVFPVGWFERNASLIANPVYTDIIYKVLKGLQAFSLLDFVVRAGVGLIFAYRLHQTALLLDDPRKRSPRYYPRKHRLSAVLLSLFTLGLFVFVEESIRTSSLACLPHPECAVKAHRWISVERGSLTQCPCLTMIDNELAPKSFDEWVRPRNVTDKVIQLAATRDLRTIQLTNRYLPMLPEALRECRHMRHLALVYTQTEVMPDWVREFTEMEYLYIEGTFSKSLASLPDGLFDNMASLTFIHLGMHLHMQTLPSFEGLKSLKALTLAIFVSLVELPAFDNLHNLERLLLISTPMVDTLPDLKSLTKLRSFVVNDRGSWCCNGFLGECHPQDPFCGQSWWVPPVSSCISSQATTATSALIQQFSNTVCREDKTYSTSGAPTIERIAQCNGTLYRQCHVPGYAEAMCYNTRFMAISCDMGPLAIRMRRRQIQEGVGDPCDPEHEAWLGCQLK